MSATNDVSLDGSATEDVRDGWGQKSSKNYDEDDVSSPNAAPGQTSNPTPRNDQRAVTFASEPNGGDHESSDPEGASVDVGIQPVESAATEDIGITDSPTATENPPTETYFTGNSPVEESRTIGSLKDQLNNALIESHYDKTRFFLPRDEAQRLVNPQSIKSYWLTHTHKRLHSKCSDVVDYVCGLKSNKGRQARLVFVILLFIAEPALVLDLLKENVCDDDLPLVSIQRRGTDFQLARKNDNNRRPVRCINRWATAQRFSFETLQWQVTAPVFQKLPVRRNNRSAELPVHEINDQDVLPLTEYDSENKYQGNSEVVRVKIHPAHHVFGHEENQSFALKSLKSEDIMGFRLEAKALVKIKPRLHLVSVLAAFKYQSKYHLLFRWAAGGNLADFWSQKEPGTDYSKVCWLAEQCHGLVDGLDGIHNAKLSESEVDRIRKSTTSASPVPSESLETEDIPSVKGDNQDCGRHGDIKPQNILWFKQDENQYGHGVLKISDFGLTTFHSALTTKVPNNVPVTYTYAAPERDIDSDLSRPFDIWSLGCVYLEFITWLLLGKDQLAEFKAKRMGQKDSRTKFKTDEFYSVIREGDQVRAIVRKPVVEWIEHLKESPACSNFLAEFLDYIQKRMMVVDKSGRDKCGHVKTKMKAMFDECKRNPEYAISCRSEPVAIRPRASSRLFPVRRITEDSRDQRINGMGKHKYITAQVKQKLRFLCL